MLSILFSRKKREKQNYFFDNELDGCFLAQIDFANCLRHERLRSERSGTLVALVIIDFPSLLDLVMERNAVSPRVFARHLADILRRYTREIDFKGLYLEGKIALLVPDTDDPSIEVLLEKLTRLIAERAGSNNGLDEKDLRRFISIASLKADRSYLIKAQPSRPLEYSTLGAGTPYLLRGDDTTCAAQWPFSLEILSQIRGKGFQLKVKRAMDIIGSLTGILFFWPLMLLIAACIKLTSPGPVLFRQKRVGLLGKPFTFLKFRSMKIDCDFSVHKSYMTKLIRGENRDINNGTDDQPVYKIHDDLRVTSIGKFLRKSSLDELPQFFNVLKGDMSLVGPRPPILYECNEYKRWHCGRVLEIKPGVTGLWQVSGRSSTTFEEMVRLDLRYVHTWNLWLDVKILFKTFWAVFSAKGGY